MKLAEQYSQSGGGLAVVELVEDELEPALGAGATGATGVEVATGVEEGGGGGREEEEAVRTGLEETTATGAGAGVPGPDETKG